MTTTKSHRLPRAYALHIMREPTFASPFGRAWFSVTITTAYLYNALLSLF